MGWRGRRATGFWHHIGDDPNEWPVFYADFRSFVFLYHRGGIAAFIADLVTGQYPRRLVGADATEGAIFVPQFV
ncbi:hypothetical protein AAFP35_22310 [Gordonia sp. CPCC 206044]